MPTARMYRKLREYAERSLAELEAAAERTREEIRKLTELERSATEVVLTATGNSVNSRSMAEMDKEHRLAISKRTRTKGNKFAVACNEAGYSMNAVAEMVGASNAALSRWASGSRKIPRSKAEAIDTIVKWAPTKKNWPAGIDDEN